MKDGGYIADIPNLDACSTFGNTPAEALAEVQIATPRGSRPQEQMEADPIG